MAKNDKGREPESETKRPADDDPDATLPMDEIIHLQANDFARDVDSTEPAQSEPTPIPNEKPKPDSCNDEDGASTIIPDPDSTVIPDEDWGTIDAADMEATVAHLDSTTRVEPGSRDESGDLEKTVSAKEMDQTVAIEPEGSSDENSTTNGSISTKASVYSGNTASAKPGVTRRESQSKTRVSSKGRVSRRDDDPSASVLASADIGETINPRELSDKDAAEWSVATGEKPGDSSKTYDSDPDPHRTIVEHHFERLRRRDVAPLKSDPNAGKDYRLVRKLGQGGMGDVYVARQGSLNRLLALKLIKPLDKNKRTQLERTGRLELVEEERRQQFLSEAIVTGDLDHPNIVPIHDVALTSSNELFYVMKRVIGTPWSKVIHEKSRDENVEILLKACDAIGFAHERGVVHRDIKPENIMLGDFGVVMVMDWGLALPTSNYEKQDSIFATSGLGGTPAFMAPEMATGPLEKIGPPSDIYLLGATLFMIVTGKAPHKAKNVTECLNAVRRNTIRKVLPECQGELLDVSLRAMATAPEDRFPDVASFQQAIRDYRSHAESISLTVRAAADLEKGKDDGSYSLLSRAAYRFEEALKSWAGNEKAEKGLAETKLSHATTAYDKGDFDLGLSLLEEENPEHAPLIEKLRSGIRERDSHASRLAAMKKVAVAMLVFIVVGSGAATFVINQKRGEALAAADAETAAKLVAIDATKEAEAATVAERAAKLEAIDATMEAEAATKRAIAATDVAKAAAAAETAAKLDAINAKQKAEDSAVAEKLAKENAVVAQNRAEYEEYVSKIGLAKARLERNEADGARKILQELRDNPHSADRADGWEWRWLWRQANQSESAEPSDAPVIDLGVGRIGRTSTVALADGRIDLLSVDETGQMEPRRSLSAEVLKGYEAVSVALSADETTVAVGTESGAILVVSGADKGDVSAEDPKVLPGHDSRVTDVQFSEDGLLVSASMDRTVRVWDLAQGRELTGQDACWHFLPVQQIAVANVKNSLVVAAAIADKSTGQVAIWRLTPHTDGMTIQRSGTWTGHDTPVSSVAISHDAKSVASGDVEGNVMVWNPESVRTIDYAGSIRRALGELKGKSESNVATNSANPPTLQRRQLVDHMQEAGQRFVSTDVNETQRPKAHNDMVRSIRFSGDGKQLLSGSDDHTLKIWDLSSGRLTKTLQGHGGWVVGAEFLGGKADLILSASNDASVRTWHPKTYVGAFLIQQNIVQQNAVKQNAIEQSVDDQAETRQIQAHLEEILSASFSNDGTKVVTASHDHTARVLSIDPQTLLFREVAKLDDEVLREGTSFVAMSMQVDNRHGRLYVGSADATIRVWDLHRGTQIGEANGTGLNASFAISNNGQWMLTGSSSPKVKAVLWKLDPLGKSPPTIAHELPRHEGETAVTAFAISPDATRLFTGDRVGIGVLWDARTGERTGDPLENVRTFRINAATFSPDGRSLLIASDDAQLTVVDLETRRSIKTLPHRGYVTQLALSPEGRHAITVSEVTIDNQFQSIATFWDLQSGKGVVLDRVSSQLAEDGTNRGAARITSALFGKNGQRAVVSRAAVGTALPQARLWEMTDLLSGPLFDMLIDSNGNADRGTGDARNASVRQGAHVLVLPRVLETAEVVVPIDGSSLLTMNKNAVFKWDLESKKLVKSYRAHAELTEACFSFDDKYIVTGSRSVKIWDATTGESLAKLESPRPIRSVQFAPAPIGQAKYVFATGGDEGVAQFWKWNPQTSEVLPLRDVPEESPAKERRIIRRVRFSSKGDRLLIVGDHGMARIRDLQQPEKSNLLEVPNDSSLRCAAFSPDGTCVAAGTTDQKVLVWKLPKTDEKNPDEETQSVELVVLEGHAGVVNDVILLGDDANTLRVLTASADDTARVWDPRLGATGEAHKGEGGREIISLRRHSGDVTAIDATVDGNLLLTAGRDGMVILWPAEPPRPNLFEAADEAGKGRDR